MPRTTLNLDPSVLDELKERARREGRPLGEVASLLLAQALKTKPSKKKPFAWKAEHMGTPRIDLSDWGKVWEFLDREMLEASREPGD